MSAEAPVLKEEAAVAAPVAAVAEESKAVAMEETKGQTLEEALVTDRKSVV